MACGDWSRCAIFDPHAEIETWNCTDRIKIIAHALVDLGYMVVVECSYEYCIMPSRAFGIGRLRPAVDHRISRRRGGSNLPHNLQIIHWGCNSYKARFEDAMESIDVQMSHARSHYDYPGQHSAFMLNEWQNPVIRARRIEALRAAAARRKADPERARRDSINARKAAAARWEKTS